MKYALLTLGVAIIQLSACGGSGESSITAIGKVEGPSIKSLSHDQLVSLYQECTKYGRIDDPQVKYTISYCAAIQSAQLSEGYTALGTAKVDPTITKVH